jgi:hypothetical protein
MTGDQDWIDANCGDADSDYEEALLNCQQTPNGQCMAAGSEYCDLECPFRDEADARVQRRKAKPLPLFPEVPEHRA